jgi:predicted CXXCH cytochrome family protein
MKMSFNSQIKFTNSKNRNIMKKLIIVVALGLIAPLMSMGQSTLGPGTITTSIAGSPHDFSTQSWNPYVNAGLGGQICQPCHTPHNADVTVVEAPLWNHQFTSGSYQMYIGTRFGLNGAGYGVTAPDGTSKLCLSCHDGSVALGSFGGQTGTTFLTGGAKLDVDLRNDHPISFPYDSIQAGGVWSTTHQYSGTKTVASMLDVNGKVQCSSCHRVHGNSVGYYLTMSNQGSALCLACHKK